MSKFSELISELTYVWWEWKKSDIFSRSIEHDYKVRRFHAENCEKLIKKEYIIIDELNKYFEETE